MSVYVRANTNQVSSYHLEVTFLRVLICQDFVVRELPAKGIWNYDDNAFRRATWRVCDIAVETMHFLDATLRRPCV